jgi:hypothetical protein
MTLMAIIQHLTPRPRPYWHVDAKWICGILLLFFLVSTLLLATLVKVTDEKHGPTIAALVIGSMFIRGDSTAASTEEARQEIRRQGGEIRPIPNFPSVVITEKDLELSTYDIKLKVFKPLTDIIYTEGVEATAKQFASTQEEKDKFVNDAFLFRIFTKETHETLRSWLTVAAILSVILLLAFIYFSAGWGRLANPGVLLLLVSLPGTVLTLMLTRPNVSQNGTDKGPLGFLPPDVAKELGNSLGGHFSLLAILGGVLLLSAIIGKIFTVFTKKSSRK